MKQVENLTWLEPTEKEIKEQKQVESICKKEGCDLECETHAGPESGSDDIWCKRCGRDYSVTYY